MAKEDKPTNSAEESAAETPETANEVTQSEGSEDFAGYANLEELRNATYASRKEGKRLADQNAQLAGYVTRLMKNEATEPDAADELSAVGIPVDALKRAVREVVQAEMAPMGRTQEAINTMRMSHPGFAKSEGDFNRWLTANPDVVSTYNQDVAALPNSADRLLRGVFAEYEVSRRPAPESSKKVASDAKIPVSRGNGSARPDPTDKISRDDMKELVKDARRKGSPVELMRALLGDKPIHRDLRPKG